MKLRVLLLAVASFAAVSSFALADDPPPSPAAVPSSVPADISAEIAAAPAYVELKEESWQYEVFETVRTFKKRIKINTAEGRSVADQRIVYYEGGGIWDFRLTAFAARTIKPDGTVVEVGPEMKHDGVSTSGKVKRHELSFTFPAVEPGATLEWEYELRREAELPWPWWEIQESIPVKEARFTAYVKRIHCQHPVVKGYSRASVAPWCAVQGQTGSEGEFDVVRYTCTQVPAYRPESLPPPENDVRLRMMFTTKYPDVIDEGEAGVIEDKTWARFVGFQRSRKEARALARAEFSTGSAQEKVEKIGWWVKKNIQIVDDPRHPGLFQGSNSDVGDLLQSRRGTADEAMLLIRVLAQEAGLKSYSTMVADGTRETFRYDLPDWDQGSRFLVEVVGDKSSWFLDPACRHCRPLTIEAKYSGGKLAGLRHDDNRKIQEGTLEIPVDVPQTPASVNVLSRRERIELTADGKAKVAGEATWGGQPEQELRDAWANLKPDRRREQFLGSEPGALADAKVETGDVDDLSVPYAVKYSFAQGDAAVAAGGTLIARPRDVVAKRLGLPLDEERKQALWWPSPFSIAVEETFVAPEGFKAGSQPEATKLAGPGLTFEGTWRAGAKPNELVYSAKVSVEKTRIPVKDYPAARAFALELRKALAAEATFEGR